MWRRRREKKRERAYQKSTTPLQRGCAEWRANINLYYLNNNPPSRAMPGRQAARRGRQTKRASATTHASAKKMDTSPVRSKRGSSSPSPKKKKKKGELEVDTSALDFQASPVRSKRGSPKRKRKRTKDQKEQNASALEFEVSSSAHSSSSSSSSEEDEESKPSPPKKQKRKHQAGKHKKLPPKPETPQHESDHEQMASIDYSSDQFLEGLPDPDGRADDSFAADVSGIFSPVLTERGSPATARKEQNLTHSHKATRRSTRKKAHALEDSDDDDEDISTGAVAFEFEDESEEEPLGKSLGDDSRSTVGRCS
jgi:hypothetical protein